MSIKFPNPGEMFEDAYRIEAILGSGGFARVYRAVETGLDRPVALKILRPPVNTSQSDTERDDYLETLMERFQREAMLLSKLRSPYTVTMYAYGKTRRGLLYMVLEYIDGLSLAEILRAGKPVAPERVAKILKQVLSSLHEAHAMGMLHRDLKPANIMVFEHLGERDQVKLLDFGIAKLVTDAPAKEDLTSDGTLIGTPRYMAPEQIQGEDIGPPADIYSLGLVAYELLTGERAIKGDSSIQIIGKQLQPGSFQIPDGTTIPDNLAGLVNKMMKKDLGERYAAAEEVIADLTAPDLLDDLAEISQIEELDSLDELLIDVDEAPPDTPIPMLPDDSIESLEGSGIDDGRMRLVVGIACVVALLLVAAVGFLVFGDSSSSGPRPSTTPAAAAEKPAPEVKVAATMGGEALPGASVFVDGVEKGVTPLTLRADEIEDALVRVRYVGPASNGELLEEEQLVSEPRDVAVEFAPSVAEAEEAVAKTTQEAAEEKAPEPKKETRSPERKRPRTKQEESKPKPKPRDTRRASPRAVKKKKQPKREKRAPRYVDPEAVEDGDDSTSSNAADDDSPVYVDPDAIE